MLQKCGQCKIAVYCSKICQKADWDVHRHKCYGKKKKKKEGTKPEISKKLLEAVENNDVEKVKTLFEKGEKADVLIDGVPVLRSFIADNRNNDIITAFVKAGADLEVENFVGQTPLIRAIDASFVSSLEWAGKTSAEISQIIIEQFKYSMEISRTLVENGANINASQHDGTTILMRSIGSFHYIYRDANVVEIDGKEVLVDQRDNYVRVYSTNIATEEYVPFLKLLLEKGADPNAQNIRGETALMHISYHTRDVVPYIVKKEYLPIVKLLLEAGANSLLKNNEGKTAIGIYREVQKEIRFEDQMIRTLSADMRKRQKEQQTE